MDHLAFVYTGDIWVSDRDGQQPARITTDPAQRSGHRAARTCSRSRGYARQIETVEAAIQEHIAQGGTICEARAALGYHTLQRKV